MRARERKPKRGGGGGARPPIFHERFPSPLWLSRSHPCERGTVTEKVSKIQRQTNKSKEKPTPTLFSAAYTLICKKKYGILY